MILLLLLVSAASITVAGRGESPGTLGPWHPGTLGPWSRSRSALVHVLSAAAGFEPVLTVNSRNPEEQESLLESINKTKRVLRSHFRITGRAKHLWTNRFEYERHDPARPRTRTCSQPGRPWGMSQGQRSARCRTPLSQWHQKTAQKQRRFRSEGSKSSNDRRKRSKSAREADAVTPALELVLVEEELNIDVPRDLDTGGGRSKASSLKVTLCPPLSDQVGPSESSATYVGHDPKAALS